MTTTIIGINLENRFEMAVKFQKIISDFGCEIKTRLGLHSPTNGVCSDSGIVLLEVDGDAELLKLELSKYWQLQIMEFK